MTTAEHQIPVLDAENPWPGLAPFDEAQAGFFYGRTREVEDLFRRVRLNLLSVLYGQSGLGKTSLVRAALFPRLRGAGLLPVPIRLDYSSGSPSAREQIWHALSRALEEAGVVVAPLAEDQTLWEYFHQRALEKSVVPVLVFDQFEELFTLGPERAGGTSFVRDCVMELAALIENRPPDRVEARFDREPRLVAQYDFDRQDYRLLLSLREDYLAHLHDLGGKIPSITLNNMRLTPLDGPRALEAVEKPGGRLVAPGAAEAIVRVVAGARDEGRERRAAGLLDGANESSGPREAPLESLVVDPSLLSLLCRELNQKRRDDRLPAITPALVEANRENILNNFYARCLSDLPEGVQIFVEEDLLTDSGFRETLTVDTAQARLRRRGSDAHALTTLVNRRLLHYEQRGAVTRVELTHDVLAPVVRQSRAVRREREAISEAEARKRRELEESERLAQQARAEAEAKYQRSKRQRRVFAAIGIAMAAVAAVAVYLGVQAGRERDRANQLLQRIESQNADLESQKNALKDTTVVARLARDTAHQMLTAATRAQAKSDSLLADFCAFTLKVINRFGDSTAGNIGLSRAYNALVQLSDESVERMVARNPAQVCPRQLDTRTEGVSTGLLLVLGDTAGARRSGKRALLAAQYLTRYSDSLSRRVLNQTYHSLASDLKNAGDYSAALDAARQGLPFARVVDPQRDSLALYWHAWLYDFGASALLELQRPAEAKVWTDSGVAVVERGKRRPDQNKQSLLYAESFLQLRRAFIALDSTIHDTNAVLSADSAAVAAARSRWGLLNSLSSYVDFANMEWWQSDHARRMGRFRVAAQSADSGVSHWAAIVLQARARSDTTRMLDGFTGMVRARIAGSFAQTGLRQHERAVTLAQAALDTARTLVQLRANADNRELLTRAWRVVSYAWLMRGADLEDANRLAAADSSYRAAVRIDSLLLEHGSTKEPEVSSDLGDHLRSLSRVLAKRARADTTGRDSSAQIALLRQADERQRGPRETSVWLWRRSVRRLNTQATRDSLASALNNLSWTYLLIDRPEQAAEAAKEGLGLSAAEKSYLPPNYFNATLLSGRDEEAAVIFRRYAGTLVEDPAVPFPCAAVRDLRELARRSIALPRHLSVVESLVAAHKTQCQNPANNPSP